MGGWRTVSVKMQHEPSTSACRPRPRFRPRAAFSHSQWANRPCGLMYRTIFFFTISCEPELAYRLQTSKMRRNSTSLGRYQHDDINIVTVSVVRRGWTAPLNPRRPCVEHFTTFYALLKHVSPKGDYFTPFSLSVNGAQTRVLRACVKKNIYCSLECKHGVRKEWWVFKK